MSRDDIEEIYSKLLTRNYQEVLFGGLEKFRRNGREYTACCPFHDDKSPSFSISADKPLWHCFAGCGGGDWIAYLEGKEGYDFKGALEYLAGEAGVELKGYDKGKWEKEKERGNLLEIALSFFKTQLWSNGGEATLKYLRDRGYTDEEIEDMELGFYPEYEATKDYLVNKSYSVNTVNSILHWLQQGGKLYREDYKVTIPFRDPAGVLKSIFGRLTRPLKEGEKETDKYKPFTDAENIRDTLFLIHKARGQKDLVIVEGYLDALICHARGLSNVVAAGGSGLTDSQLESAIHYRAKNIILALNNDEARQKGTERQRKYDVCNR